MAIEFQQHPSSVLECDSAKAGLLNLTIPRLCKREVASLQFGSKSVVMERYTGPKNVKPPHVVCRYGPPFTTGKSRTCPDHGHSMAELPPA